MDDLWQRRILGIAMRQILFATDFLGSLTAVPAGVRPNTHACERNRALVAVNAAVAPWVWIVMQIRDDSQARRVSRVWTVPEVQVKDQHAVYLRTSLKSGEWYLGETDDINRRTREHF